MITYLITWGGEEEPQKQNQHFIMKLAYVLTANKSAYLHIKYNFTYLHIKIDLYI